MNIHEIKRRQYTTLMQQGKEQEALALIKQKYDPTPDPFALTVDANLPKKTHARTGGFGDLVRLRFNPKYMKKMYGSEERFAKLLGTYRHERLHVTQRSIHKIKPSQWKALKAQREFMAYSEELLPSSVFPRLTGELRARTIHKMQRQFSKIRYPTRSLTKRKTTAELL